MTKVNGWIDVRGARTHNLRNISVRIPRNQLVAITGVSGSGKSSLAFDTIFVEGQRRFLETASPFVRSQLQSLPAPDVDAIAGLPPTLSVDQHRGGRINRRQTVATATELHEYFRLLFSRCGTPYCPRCSRKFEVVTQSEIVDAVMSLPEGEKIHILAPLARQERGDLSEHLARVRRESFLRIRLDGVLGMADANLAIDPNEAHDLELVVDRQIVRSGSRDRLAESIALALKLGEGVISISTLTDDFDWVDRTYSTRFACPECRQSFAELEPRTFNPDSPYGACPACHGLGVTEGFLWSDLFPDESISLADGALAAIAGPSKGWPNDLRTAIRKWEQSGGDTSLPVKELNPSQRSSLLELLVAFEQTLEDSENELARFVREQPCEACHGARLSEAGRSVRLGTTSLPELLSFSVESANEFFRGLLIPEKKKPIADPILTEVRSRLEFLTRVGVGYLELERPLVTLSGGEVQRTRLAGCVGAAVHGVCYVLDEPTTGLHARDIGRLVDVLEELRDRGSSVVIVEHDESALKRADWFIEVGPSAGIHGGTLVGSGVAEDFLKQSSLTADYLTGRKAIPQFSEEPQKPARWLGIAGVTHRNLKNVAVRFPHRQLSVVTGVSGSGKSSLVAEVLAPALLRHFGRTTTPGAFETLTGCEGLAAAIVVDQSPIGRSPRSIPATFLGVLDPMRNVFAQTKEARARGYGITRFSFNHPTGRCNTCKGLGAQRFDLAIAAAEFVPCVECRGRRFDASVLEIKFRGLSIAEALSLSVEEAADFFENHPKIARPLRVMVDVGLGYLRLDQWATTLSGGEAQRLKLAAELAKANAGPTVFLLDEPTSGLHFHDVVAVLYLLRKLIASGHTVIAVEHHLGFIRASDWVVDLGPEGGAKGGEVIAQCRPGELVGVEKSVTGQMLKRA